MVDDAVDEGRKGSCVAECTTLDGFKDNPERGIKLVFLIKMSVTEIINILSEITEQENVVFADFASDLNLWVR
jgi:hypothetical protein